MKTVEDTQAVEPMQVSDQSLPAPLPLEVLSKTQHAVGRKPKSALKPEPSIPSDEVIQRIKQEHKKLKRAKTQKEYGEIKVKVLKPKAPWDLPPIKMDKEAYEFLQTALYKSRNASQKRRKVGLVNRKLIAPASKFVRNSNWIGESRIYQL